MHAHMPPYSQDPEIAAQQRSQRFQSQQPTGAYRSAPEMPESERKLRTALSYVAHARDLITDALKLVEQESKPAEPERVAKWDPRWPKKPPNCDGLSARDVRAPQTNPIKEALDAADRYERDDNASGV